MATVRSHKFSQITKVHQYFGTPSLVMRLHLKFVYCMVGFLCSKKIIPKNLVPHPPPRPRQKSRHPPTTWIHLHTLYCIPEIYVANFYIQFSADIAPKVPWIITSISAEKLKKKNCYINFRRAAFVDFFRPIVNLLNQLQLSREKACSIRPYSALSS
jgi:energy-converting hydrogenase Eha subunit F